MTPHAIIEQARADGVSLLLSDTGILKAIGDEAAVRHWLSVIRERKAEIIEVLKGSANQPCAFDHEAFEERAVIRDFDGLCPQEEAEGTTWAENDRRRCAHCLNRLPNGICKVAAPGGLVSANRGYRPDPVRLHRCAGYRPCPDDPDRRSGRERWPWLDTAGPVECTDGELAHEKM